MHGTPDPIPIRAKPTGAAPRFAAGRGRAYIADNLLRRWTMTLPPDEPTGPSPAPAEGERRLHPGIYIARRRARLETILMQPLVVPRGNGVSEESRTFLLEEAEELFWNELEWEKLTSEEMSEGGSSLVERTFPGFLAFIDGLLLKEVHESSPEPARPKPEVVEEILVFLAQRYLELLPWTEPEARLERAWTERLIDLVLYRLHGLSVDRVLVFEPPPTGTEEEGTS